MRSIPSIEQLRQRPEMLALEARYGRAAVVGALRAEAAAARERFAAGEGDENVIGAFEQAVAARLAADSAPSLRRVINATGVVIHTNLGRAPLARAAADRVVALATGYTNLEYDIERGTRGRRDVHAERLLCRLTGAEAAVVVNNNAAATLLVLAALAAGREVIISRGELVEIGGGFRVPDVMAQSGAILREVGTTNRTRAADYAAAIGDRTALILRVHPSNFRVEGFTGRPQLAELVELGRRFRIPVAEDLGSGYLPHDGWQPDALREEPAVPRSLADGAHVVMFSGDKLLGGPQAGIIAGASASIATIRAHPLMRALRVDKLTYAALEATLGEYAAGRARSTIPVAMMLALSSEQIGRRADAVAAALSSRGVQAQVADGHSTIGGGSAPGSALPTRLIILTHPTLSTAAFERRLRLAEPPIVARIEHDRVVLDLRTVNATDDEVLTGALNAAAGTETVRLKPDTT
jgi:L-seryl-tRNA(Ser) seleniumtransferase